MKNKFLSKLTDIYVFFLIVIFPLIIDKTGYFNILNCKWKALVLGFIMYISIVIIYFFGYYFKRKINLLKQIKLNKIHKSIIILIIVYILSTIFSPYLLKHNLLIGVGRAEGLIINLVYLISALLISLFLKPSRKHLLYIAISSICISFIFFLQYLGLNPFNLYQKGLGMHNSFFVTTIGNIDTVSAIYCLFIPISFLSYIFLDNNKKEKIIYIISLIFSFFTFSIINVLSGKVALICFLIIVLPLIILSSKYLTRFLEVLIMFLIGYGINIIINSKYFYDYGKIMIKFNFDLLVLVFIVLIILLYIGKKIISKNSYNYSNDKKLLKKIYCGILISGLLFIICLFLFKFNIKILSEIHEILHGNFNDKFGTYRMFLWKRTIPLIFNYPILGSGPDTFCLQFMSKYTMDVLSIGPYSINDTAGNIYLTMLVNIGIVGLLCYLRIFYLLLRKLYKSSIYYKILFLTIVCYLIQSCFNLSVVIVTPIFWTIVGICIASVNVKEI